MSDLRCTRCGEKASYADASIADSKRTCGSDDRPIAVEKSDGSIGYTWDGQTHNWERVK